MDKVISLRRFRSAFRMIPVQVRLPQEIREKARELAASQSTPNDKITETDVYRTAIYAFLKTTTTERSEERAV